MLTRSFFLEIFPALLSIVALLDHSVVPCVPLNLLLPVNNYQRRCTLTDTLH